MQKWVFGRSASQVSAPFTTPGPTVVERFTFADADTINYEVTMTDPNLYSRPWTISTEAFVRAPARLRLFEDACHEGTEPHTSSRQEIKKSPKDGMTERRDGDATD